jgi:hypothetical protein
VFGQPAGRRRLFNEIVTHKLVDRPQSRQSSLLGAPYAQPRSTNSCVHCGALNHQNASMLTRKCLAISGMRMTTSIVGRLEVGQSTTVSCTKGRYCLEEVMGEAIDQLMHGCATSSTQSSRRVAAPARVTRPEWPASGVIV